MNFNSVEKNNCFDFLLKLPDSSVDLIITDPPYSTPVITSFGRKKFKNLADLSIQELFFTELKKQFERVLKPDGRIFIFCDDKFYPVLFAVFYDWLNLQLIVWDKQKIGMGRPIRKQHELILYGNRQSYEFKKNNATHCPSVLRIKSESDKVHGAQKPIELLKILIAGFSNEGEIVLDCFAGSGNTAIASISLKRRFVGADLNLDFCKTANSRIEEVSGIPPTDKSVGILPTFL